MKRKEQWKIRFDWLLPPYARPWFFGAVFALLGVYYGNTLITDHLPHYDVTLPVDGKIPFIPEAVLVYVLAFAFWIVNGILIAREDKETCSRVLLGVIIAKLLSLFIFIVYPTTMVRPEVSGTGFCTWLVRLIYRIDRPINLFPSIHCLNSWVCWRGIWHCKKVPGWYRKFSLIFAIMICASTVLVHQHVILDIPSGILMAEIGLFLSRRFWSRKEGSR